MGLMFHIWESNRDALKMVGLLFVSLSMPTIRVSTNNGETVSWGGLYTSLVRNDPMLKANIFSYGMTPSLQKSAVRKGWEPAKTYPVRKGQCGSF